MDDKGRNSAGLKGITNGKLTNFVVRGGVDGDFLKETIMFGISHCKRRKRGRSLNRVTKTMKKEIPKLRGEPEEEELNIVNRGRVLSGMRLTTENKKVQMMIPLVEKPEHRVSQMENQEWWWFNQKERRRIKIIIQRVTWDTLQKNKNT